MSAALTPLGALPRLSPSARRALLIGGLLAVCNAAALIVQAWALASALADVVTAGAGAEQLTQRLLVLAGAIGVRAVLGWATEWVSARAAAGAKEELRSLLIHGALRRGPEWIQRRGSAELTALATKGLDSLDAYFTRYLPALITAAVVPALVGGWILLNDVSSALTILITVPLIPLFAWLVGRFTEERTAHAADSVQRLSGQVLELIRALPILTAFGRARAQRAAVRQVSEDHRGKSVATLRIAFLSALVLELCASLSVALVAVGIGLRLVSGELDLSTGLLILILAPECYLPLRAAGAAHHASEDGVEAVRRVDNATRILPDAGSSRAVPQSGSLCVAGLRVSRRGGNTPDGLDFTAHPGKILLLDGFDGIGPSGSGKSTVFSVLLGFVEPDAGTVSYGGSDLSTVDRAGWRRRIAWVPQHPTFTGATVPEELEIAVSDQPNSTATDPLPALRDAAAEHLVDRRIDDLSTGERQRIAVARALLRLRGDATILLLDEPTAHLDAATAHQVTGAIHHAAESGAIVVLASHRPDAPEAVPEPAPGISAAVDTDVPATRGRLRDLLDRRTFTGSALGALSLLSGLALTATAAWLIARASQQPPILSLTVATVGVRTFAISRAVLRYVERLVTHDAAFRLAGRLRVRLWNALVRLGPVRTANLHRNDGVARLVDDADAVRDLVPRVLVPPLVAVVVLVAAVTLQTLVLPSAGALLACAVLAAAVASPVAALAAERRATAAVAAGRRQVHARVLALLDGSAELLAFGAHSARCQELAEVDADLTYRARRAAFGTGAATAVITLCIGTAVLGATWLGANAVAAGRLAPELAPLLALLPLATAEVLGTLPPAAQQWSPLRSAQARLAPLLAVPEPEADEHDERTPDGSIELSGVDARWPGAPEPALRDVTIQIPSGTHVAVVGPSGGGKSTLLAVLLGFLPAERGRVRLPRRLTWCPQQPQLVSTSVRENLRVAAPRANDEQHKAALRLAGLPAWADRLGEPVTTASLSGGEAQRLALARALLVDDAALVLLDEPTAHLDVPTSEALLERVGTALDDRTVLHVTHRWAETEHADLVLRVDRGVITVLRSNRPADVPH